MCLGVSINGQFAKVLLLNRIYLTVPISVCMENRTLSYSGDPLVREFLCQHFVSLYEYIISVCMSFFPFSLRLAECRYKGELALISCKMYSIISEPTKTDQCVQDNICRL